MFNNKAIFLFLLILLFDLTQAFSASPEQVDQDTLIEIGDELQIFLKEDTEFQFRGAVNNAGNITLTYLGEVSAANSTIDEFKARLEKLLLEQYYKKATLSISITQKAAATDIYVYGAVQEPGAIEVPSSGRMSIQQALASVKGLTAWANPKESYILRMGQSDEQMKESVDIQAMLSRLSQKNLVLSSKSSVYLYAGDELYIPGSNQDDSSEIITTTPREVIVVGQVRNPGIQSFAPGENATLMRAIFKAGGMTQFARGNQIKLIRYQDEDRIVQNFNIDRVIKEGYLEEDVNLNSGDMIIVPQKLINF